MKISTVFAKLFPFLIYATGILYFCLRILDFHLGFVPGDLGDSRFINFLLEHGHRWITGHETSFWNAEFMYPFKNSIALSDNMLGTVPLYSIWRIFGCSAETSYQLWWLSVCSLNYWLCYIILKKWGLRPEVAAILSWLFAFSLFNLGQLNYMQMIVRFMVPLVFYSAVKLVSTPSLKYLILYCLGIVVQMYCVMYTGIYLFYFSVLFIVVYSIFTKYHKNISWYFNKQRILFTITTVAVSVVLLLWILLPYHEMSKTIGLRWYREVVPNLPTWKSFLYPHESSVTYPFFKHMGPVDSEYWLHYLFPGAVLFITLIVSPVYLVYATVKKKQVSPLLSTFIICSFLIALIHLRTEGGLTLYGLIFKLPGINSMRVPIRFMHVEIFLLVFIVGAIVSKIKNTWLLLVVFGLFFADSLFDPTQVPRTTKKELSDRKEHLKNLIDASDNKNYQYLAVVDTVQPGYIIHLDAMLVAQSMGIKTLNGYSSYCPDAYGEFFRKCNRNGLMKWATDQQIPVSEILIIDNSKNR